MHNNRRSSRPQRHRINQQSRAIHAYDFFNRLTDDDLLEVVDQQLPVYRDTAVAAADHVIDVHGADLEP